MPEHPVRSLVFAVTFYSNAKAQSENIGQPTFNIEHRMIPSLVHYFAVGRSMLNVRCFRAIAPPARASVEWCQTFIAA